MKVIHVVLGKANPNRMNGVNKVVNSLAHYQTVLGQDVAIWGITHTPKAPIPHRNYPTRLFPALKHKFWLHASIKQAIQQIGQPTVFHLHGGFIPEFYHFSQLLHKYQIPFVHTAHGAYNTIAMQRNKRLKQLYFTCFEKTILKNAQTLHFIGSSELAAIHGLIDHPNCTLIPNGQEMLDQRYRKKPQVNAPIFGFCGRLDIHTKGLDVLVKAFAQYHKQQPSSKLWLIGDSDERLTLTQLIHSLGIAHHVIFWGKQFGKEKEELMQQMDVFFHPSRNEGLPGAVLEAAAMGIPCVVSKESNVGAYIDQFQAGKCLKQNNVKELTKTMLEMHQAWEDQSAYQQFQKNAITMVKEAFDWHRLASQHLDVYYQSLNPSTQFA
ncbi:MAG: glycosyltransferase family 4 protein [Flammeovirgaceae bacterium]